MTDQLKHQLKPITGQIHSFELLAEQGATSKVHKIRAEQRTFALKSCTDDRYRQWLGNEGTVLEKLSKTDTVPTPKYFGFFEDDTSSHLLTSFEEGITLTAALREAKSIEQKKALLQSFGSFLQAFHELEPLSEFETDQEWLHRKFAKAQHYINLKQTSGSQQLLDTLMANHPSPIQQTMIHGDCTTDNVMVRDNEVRLFIDVAAMTLGDPRYDVALAINHFKEDADLLDAFYSGYKRFQVSNEEFNYFEEGLYEFF